MSSKAEKRVARPPRRSETVVNFEPERLSAPFSLRVGSMLIDYIIVLIFPVAAMLLGRYFGDDGARRIGGSLNDTGWLIALLVAGTNIVVLPAFSGQSIGKLITGIKIVSVDGRQAGATKIVLRNLLGYILTLGSIGLGFLISAVTRSGRSLHDYLFGTVVIYADRRLK